MTLTTSDGLQYAEKELIEVHAVYVSLCQALSMAASVNVCKETILALLSAINVIIKSSLPEYHCVFYVISVNVNGREKSTITHIGFELIACPQEQLIQVANKPHLKRHVTLCLIEERGTVQSYSMLDALSRGTTRYFMTTCNGVIALGALTMERCNAVVLQLKGKHPRPSDSSTLALSYDLSAIMARGTHSSKARHQATARSQSGYGDDTFDDGVNRRDEMTAAYFEYETQMKKTYKWNFEGEVLDITAPRQRLGKTLRAVGMKKPSKKCNKLPVTTPQIVAAFIAEQFKKFITQSISIADETMQANEVSEAPEESTSSQVNVIMETMLVLENERPVTSPQNVTTDIAEQSRNFSMPRVSITDELTQSSEVNVDPEERTSSSEDSFINEALLALERETLDFLAP